MPAGVSVTARSARAAAAREWVASRQAAPCSRTCSTSSARTRSAVAGSRLPVGSSARISVGRCTSARAIATRCSWPPESVCGRRVLEAGEADRGQHRGDARRVGRVLQQQRQADVGADAQVRQDVEGLEHEAEALAPEDRLRRLGERMDVAAGDAHRAGVDRVEAGDAVEERRLADAGLADDGDELARRRGRDRRPRTPCSRRSAWRGRRSAERPQPTRPSSTRRGRGRRRGAIASASSQATTWRHGIDAQPRQLALGELARRRGRARRERGRGRRRRAPPMPGDSRRRASTAAPASRSPRARSARTSATKSGREHRREAFARCGRAARRGRAARARSAAASARRARCATTTAAGR